MDRDPDPDIDRRQYIQSYDGHIFLCDVYVKVSFYTFQYNRILEINYVMGAGTLH